MGENYERNGPSEWLIDRRGEREKIMNEANGAFDKSPQAASSPSAENEENNSVLIIESESNDSSSSSADESSDGVIAIEESEEEEDDGSDKSDSDGFEIIEDKSTVKPPATADMTVATTKSDDDQPEIICLSDALSSDTDIGAEKLAKKAKKKEKKRAKKELKKIKKESKKNARKLSNVSDEWAERMKKRRESLGQIGPALPTELEETFIDCWKRVPGIEQREEGVNFSEHIRGGKRIPLRGQEGMSLDQIDAFERAGYRMSGRSKRQTEARAMRAERKVYTQEEKRMLEKVSRDDRVKAQQDKLDAFKHQALKKVSVASEKLSSN